ncbi:MAG: NAD(P)-dependent oxidoreductase [Actinomycetes bacterium]
MPRVAMLAPLPPEVVTSRLPDVEVVCATSQDQAVEAARGADVCIADWRGEVRVDAEVAAALSGTCRLVQVPAAGLNGVDLDACAAAGVPVASCAGLNTAAVAEWCVWAALDALRLLSWSDRALRDGRWEMFGHARYELAGKLVGIVGLGDIGAATARRLAGFEVDVAYWSRRRRDATTEADLGVRFVDLDDLVALADVLVLAVALTDDTRGLLSAERIAAMKPSAVVVNAARGEVTDEAALAAAVAEGRLHGAATDVFAVEPPPVDHPMVATDRTVVTPHIAGTSAESVGRIVLRVLDNVEAVLDGREPVGVLTP